MLARKKLPSGAPKSGSQSDRWRSESLTSCSLSPRPQWHASDQLVLLDLRRQGDRGEQKAHPLLSGYSKSLRLEEPSKT